MFDKAVNRAPGAQLIKLPNRALGSDDLGPIKAYWDRVRAGRIVPARADIDPEAMHPYLGQSGIIERTRPGTVKIRLAGRKLEALMGMEMRGMPLRAMFTVAHRDRLEALLTQVFEGPRVLTMGLSAAFEGQPLVTAHLALMPLSDIRGEVTRALMVMTPQSEPARMPCRFDIHHAHLALIATETPTDPPRAETPQLRVITGGLA